MLFDGGTRGIRLKDGNGVQWHVQLQQVGAPEDETGSRELQLTRVKENETTQLPFASGAVVQLESGLSDWLYRQFPREQVLRLARRTDFGRETDAERNALIVIDVIAGIRMERTIEGNAVLAKQRSAIAAKTFPAMMRLAEVWTREPADGAEAALAEQLHMEGAALVGRWKEFYRTLEGIIRHPEWVP